MDRTFIGSYIRTLDSKGRFLLPPDFLKAVNLHENGGSIWITSFYGKLTAYLPLQWKDIVDKLCSISMPSLHLANFISKIIGLANELIPDAQGRLRIPQPLMREAGLTKDIVIVGIINKFEIWDQARFDAIALEDVSAELNGSGINITL